MQFEEPLNTLDWYYLERRELQTQNGKLHAEIWRLGGAPGADAAIARHRRDIRDNTRRIRTIDLLVGKIRLALTSQMNV